MCENTVCVCVFVCYCACVTLPVTEWAVSNILRSCIRYTVGENSNDD
jgi:hypothetical protein